MQTHNFSSLVLPEHDFSALVLPHPQSFFDTEHRDISEFITALSEQIFAVYTNPHDLKYIVMGCAVRITCNAGAVNMADLLLITHIVEGITRRASIPCPKVTALLTSVYEKIK